MSICRRPFGWLQLLRIRNDSSGRPQSFLNKGTSSCLRYYKTQSLTPPRRPSLPRPVAADEFDALDETRRYCTNVSSLPLLALEYFHEYLDRYFTKEQMRRDFRGCARSVPARIQLHLTPAHSNQDSDLGATGFLLISKVLRNPTHRT